MCALASDIQRVFVYDDSKYNRKNSVEALQEIGLEAVAVDEPLSSVSEIIEGLDEDSGLFCDYHLKKCGRYTPFDGDMIVAEAYKANKAALLCTTYTNFDTTLSRILRRYIPVVLTSRDFHDIECIARGFKVCLDEFRGKFTSERKPWRALVRVEEVDLIAHESYIVVPSWQADLKIQVFWDHFPEDLQPFIKREGQRLHAMVNLGSEHVDSLYLYDWETS